MEKVRNLRGIPNSVIHTNLVTTTHNMSFVTLRKEKFGTPLETTSTAKKEIHLLPEYNAQQEVFIWIDNPCTKKNVEIFHVEEPKTSRHPF